MKSGQLPKRQAQVSSEDLFNVGRRFVTAIAQDVHVVRVNLAHGIFRTMQHVPMNGGVDRSAELLKVSGSC